MAIDVEKIKQTLLDRKAEEFSSIVQAEMNAGRDERIAKIKQNTLIKMGFVKKDNSGE